ncbi:uncharacterized protein DNG_09966 [Cephalotrichum gorgonifer]|uniref:2EXR domain-containing protein n=1 Tax=Cephalotrichum gorgonifer TaxID=2041049 RepID=A0AAE8N8V8_9PEZI|nr:uncharacterized protein DNG_09966 [Cephalotrichum gorgonifer]
MDGPSQSTRHGPQLRQIISTSVESMRLQAARFRARRGSPASHEPEPEALPWNGRVATQTVTCKHIANSWFSEPAVRTTHGRDEARDRERERDAEENALATLGELLVESVVFGSVSAFYPPNPTLSAEKQSAIRQRLLSAFESVMQHRKATTSSLFRRSPPARPPPEPRTFTLFPSLPAEIRLQIWRAALPPRGYRTLHIGQTVGESYCWTARLARPVLFWVCRESREVVRRKVFPIHADAPYRSGRSTEMKRFTTSWASEDDCLDFGAFAYPMALRCGQYLDKVRSFSAVAHNLSNILGPAWGVNEMRRQGTPPRDEGGVEKVMVVIQVVYIALPTQPPGALLDEAMQAHRSELPALAEANIVVRSVDHLAPLDPLVYRADAQQRLKDHHVTTVADLRDRARLKELLALGTVTRYWTDRHSRLRALLYHSNAFCMDCLLEWWDKVASEAAREALLKLREGDTSLAGVSQRREDPLPELVPAVRFKIQWPGFQEDRS